MCLDDLCRPLVSKEDLVECSDLQACSKFVLSFLDSLDFVPEDVLSSRPEFRKLFEFRERFGNQFKLNV